MKQGVTQDCVLQAMVRLAELGADIDANVAALLALAGELLPVCEAVYVAGADGERHAIARWSRDGEPRRDTDVLLRHGSVRRARESGAAGEFFWGATPAAGGGELLCSPVVLAGAPVGALCLSWCRATRTSADEARVVVLLTTGLAAEERRRRAQAALRESREKYRELSELGAEAIFLIDNETGRLLEANSAATALYGFSREELLEMRNEHLSAQPSETRRVTTKSVHGPVAVPNRLHRRKDGSVFPVEIAGRFFRWQGRDVHIAAIRDVSERVRFEEALEKRVLALTQPVAPGEEVALDDLFNVDELQRIQDAFADVAEVASLITRPDGSPITRPSRFCRLCNDIIRKTKRGLQSCMRSDAAIGRHNPSGPVVQPCLSGGLWDAGASITVGGRHVANWLIGQVRSERQDEESMLAYADEIGVDREQFREALAEVPRMSEERFARIAEAVFLLANELSLRAWQNFQQARFIAERRRAETERQQLQQQLQHAMKMEAVGRLAGGVAHDFNNLLTTISGNAELLAGAPDAPAASQAALREIMRASDSAASLTRQILAFSRKQVVQPKVVAPNKVVGDLSRMLRRIIGENIRLEAELHPECGTIRVDPGQFEQIFVNLAVNARDAMPDGGALRITTAVAELSDEEARAHEIVSGRYVCLTVTDNGVGMDEAVRERIFEPFFTTKSRGRGTGLGLATTYGAVRQAGGAISVSSMPGSGTTFRILFPQERRTEAVASESEVAAPEATPRGSETVLLVEDDEMVRALAGQILTRYGYTVHEAETAEQGLEIARRLGGRLQLLLTDVVLPGMNGRQLAARLETIAPRARVLYTSGYAENVLTHRGEIDPSLNFLAKPYTPRELGAAVREALAGADDR